MRRTFVSAGWPYLYEIPGLHNCIPMLFADAVARYRRLAGDQVAFVSGADEHGARVEFVADGVGKGPRELVDEKVAATRPLLARLEISLDVFARTSDAAHEAFVTGFVHRLVARGAVERRTVRVPFCPTCERHLPDRFAEGSCPRCGGPAFGNQCNEKRRCGAILDPFQLRDGRCAVCGGPYQASEREHLVLPFGPWHETLRRHIESSYADAPAVRERALRVLDAADGMTLTRDTAWGVPLPEACRLPGRTVYSWVDSLLGKVSAVAAMGREGPIWKEAGADKLFFLGADGVGFYAVLLPALLLAAGEGYALDGFRIATNDVLIYEGGVCSKSGRNGIWLPEALALLPGDYWRFIIFEAEAQAARGDAPAGSADLDFRWDSFAQTANERLGAIGRLYASLAGRAPTPLPDAPSLVAVRHALDALQPGAAFGLLMDALVAAPRGAGEALAAGALPLLSCFLPDAARRAAATLDGAEAPPLFPELPLDGAALKGRYTRAVADRRSGLDLEAEMTDIRADALCVCPVRLDEG